MPLTLTQKKWAVGGTIAAVALAVGYGLFHSRSAYARPFSGDLPAGHFQGELGGRLHRKKFRHREAHGGRSWENERGEYGRKKHHHGRHFHG